MTHNIGDRLAYRVGSIYIVGILKKISIRDVVYKDHRYVYHIEVEESNDLRILPGEIFSDDEVYFTNGWETAAL